MPRVSYTDFSRGLWEAGPHDRIPPGTLRRARAIRTLRGTNIRSRWGHQQLVSAVKLQANALHSITAFNGKTWVGAGRRLFRVDGIESVTLISSGGLNAVSGPFRFAVGVPTLETDAASLPQGVQHLVVVGFDFVPIFVSSGGDISPLGIAPPDPPTLSIQTAFPGFKTIETFDAGLAGVPGFSPVMNATFEQQQGTTAGIITANAEQTTSYSKFLTPNLDLSRQGAVDSPDEDWIQMWVFATTVNFIDSIEILIDVGDSTLPADPNTVGGLEDTYSFRITVGDDILPDELPESLGDVDTRTTPTPTFGSNVRLRPDGSGELRTGGTTVILAPPQGYTATTPVVKRLLEGSATTRLASVDNTWTLIRIPKAMFERSGRAGVQRTWANVRRIRLSITATKEGTAVAYVDDLKLYIGAGLIGDYKYAVTRKNTVTGVRSNPSEIVEIKGVARDFVALSSLPGGGPNIVNEIWRTVGGGNVLFKAFEVTASISSLPDNVADATPLRSPTANQLNVRPEFGDFVAGPTTYLTNEELPYDNAQFPIRTLIDVAGPLQGSMFYLDAGPEHRGRLLFTPPGRIGSFGGFVDVTGGLEDELARIFIFAGSLYVLSHEGLWQISGSYPAFLPNRIYGAAGCTRPNTVVLTPFGVVYQSTDGGIRLFDGASTRLVGADAMRTRFVGEPGQGGASIATPFLGNAATYKDEEYIIGNATTSFALNLRTDVWREIGTPFSALFTYHETNQLLGGTTALLDIEKVGQKTDNGAAIPFLVELPGTLLEDQSGVTKLVQRLYLDIDTSSLSLTVRARFVDAGFIEGASPGTQVCIVNTAGRKLVEVPLLTPVDVIAVEVSGSIVEEVEIFGIGYDVHLTEPAGVLT